MEVQVGEYAGFCMGVQRAVEMVLEAASAHTGVPINTFGPLIHNPQVMSLLVKKGINILTEIPENGSGIVLIRAHGVQPSVKARLQRAGFDVIDATCPRVVRIQNLIRAYTAKGYASIIIGDRTHPEIIGLLGYTAGHGHVVSEFSQLETLPEFEKAIIVSQSTQNTVFYEQVRQWAAENHPHYKALNTICDSTEYRQAEAQRLSKEVDLIVVVGGRDSANTKRLYDIVRKTGKSAFHIETEKDLDPLDRSTLASVRKIGVTAGASTPNWVIRNVYRKLQGLGDPAPKDAAFTDDVDRKRNREEEREILRGVSRFFALTVPQLPEGLRERVTTAYLLCRIADTIEDEESLPVGEKRRLFGELKALINDRRSVGTFTHHLLPLLSERTLPAEKELIRRASLVLDNFFTFNEKQQKIVARCLGIMADGMLRFQEIKSLDGLPALADMNEYCYHVAGVVGEMLTELFCDYSEEIDMKRERLLTLAPSFGQGLQMTNILKDVWEDQDRRACCLPREPFEKVGFDLRNMGNSRYSIPFGEGVAELVAITHGHLRNGLAYTLLIPKDESGIRKFCLWATGVAVLTLQNIYRRRHYSSGDQVKISRRDLKTVILTTNLWIRNDFMLKHSFDIAARGLPVRYEKFVSRPFSGNFAGGSNILCRL